MFLFICAVVVAFAALVWLALSLFAIVEISEAPRDEKEPYPYWLEEVRCRENGRDSLIDCDSKPNKRESRTSSDASDR